MMIYSLDVSFLIFEPVHFSMSDYRCCFLSCIQVFKRQVRWLGWYSHFFKNFPQFVVIHTVKDFSIVNEAEIDVLLEFLDFSMTQWMFATWSLVPLYFLNPACTSGSSRFMYYWSLAWRILSISLQQLNILWHCSSLGLEWKLTFSSPVDTAELSKFAGTLSAAL